MDAISGRMVLFVRCRITYILDNKNYLTKTMKKNNKSKKGVKYDLSFNLKSIRV